MKKSAVLALLVVILLPFAGYFIVKHYSKDAVHVPKRYFPESIEVDENGKTDTIWHKVKDMTFTNQMGKQVRLSDIKSNAIVINYFFTRCPSICPRLTQSMKKLQEAFHNNPNMIHFVSISVDPEHDQVEQLRRFADRFGVNHDNWWFVTADKKEIYDFAIQEMKASIADPGIDTAFIHTEDFFLLDSQRVIRGWYNGFDEAEQAELARAVPTLMLERDKSKPSILHRFVPILPILFIGLAIVIVAYVLLKRKSS